MLLDPLKRQANKPLPLSSMRPLVARLVIYGSTAAFLCSCAGKLTVSEEMMWSTYPVATQKGQATGFVINYPDPLAKGGASAVVLTSAHVLATMGNRPMVIGLRLKRPEGGAVMMPLMLAPEKQSGSGRFYVRHPTCDVAAFRVRLPSDIKQQVDLSTSLDERALRTGKGLRTGDDVSLLGYPEVLPGTDGGFAVLRSGKVASYPVGIRSAENMFLINTDVYPGDSGAPVFVSARYGRPRLVGMLSSRIAANEESFSHLAVAVDAAAIRETLALLHLPSRR
jgi:hypothetical protein